MPKGLAERSDLLILLSTSLVFFRGEKLKFLKIFRLDWKDPAEPLFQCGLFLL